MPKNQTENYEIIKFCFEIANHTRTAVNCSAYNKLWEKLNLDMAVCYFPFQKPNIQPEMS